MIKQLLICVAGCAGIVLGAKLRIPVEPVPFTLQTFFVLLLCFRYKPFVATTSSILYILCGLFLPVFSGDTYGTAVLCGPTAGYVFAFPLAAWACSYIYHQRNTPTYTIRMVYALCAHLFILVCGSMVLAAKTDMHLADVAMKGIVLLLPGAVVKSAAVAINK